MFSSHTGSLMLPSGHLLRAHIFSELNTSLLSISDLVDIGYEITYSKAKVDFTMEGTSIFEGQRNLRTGLWMVDFAIFKPSKITKSPNSKVAWSTTIAPALDNRCAYPTKCAAPAVEVNSVKEFVAYWHAAFGYPSKSTFVRNIRNGNIAIDGLSVGSVRRNFVPSVYTAMGHLDATRSNIRSTKEPFVSESSHPHTTPLVWVAIHESTGRLHSDQTGSLPVLGRHKERYLFIMFDETSNFIYAVALTDLSAESLRAATEGGLNYFAAHGSVAKILPNLRISARTITEAEDQYRHYSRGSTSQEQSRTSDPNL
jgi:hypothetical protein